MFGELKFANLTEAFALTVAVKAPASEAGKSAVA